MTPLVLRCEATPALGTGHALRCLALAQEWTRRGGRAVFAMVEPKAAIAARIRAAGAAIELLPVTPGSAADAVASATLAQRMGARWLVLDGPMFGPAWDEAWPAEVRLLRVDDNGLDHCFRGEVLLNQNIGATAADYPAKTGPCRLLLGPDFALLRPEFLGVPAVERGARVVVTLGGSDPAEATERVLAALLEPEARGIDADFVIGAANPRRSALLAAIGAHGPRLQAVVAPPDLPARFARAQSAVTAGGTTLYELALLRAPMLLVCTAENQRRTCERFAAAGAAEYLGWHADVPPQALARALAALSASAAARASLAAAAGRMVDGKGTMRVAEAMLGGGA